MESAPHPLNPHCAAAPVCLPSLAPCLPCLQNYQTDWEAILESSPERFLASVGSWMYPPELAKLAAAGVTAAGNGNGTATTSSSSGSSGGGGTNSSSSEGPAAQPPCPPVDHLPKVRGTSAVAALLLCILRACAGKGGCSACFLCERPRCWPHLLLCTCFSGHLPSAPARSSRCCPRCEPGWKRSTAPACRVSDGQPSRIGGG